MNIYLLKYIVAKQNLYHMKELFTCKNVAYARSMCASNVRAFNYHTGLLKVITCNLRGLSYRGKLGVIIFNGRSILYLRVLQWFSRTHTFLKVSM